MSESDVDRYIDKILGTSKKKKVKKQRCDQEAEEKAFKKLKKIIKKRKLIDKQNPIKKLKVKKLKSAYKLDFEEQGFCDNISKINCHRILSTDSCIHEVALPPDQEYVPLAKPQTIPSKIYPFELDLFQKQATHCIENDQSVLVSAHTSAGKTVVAEYAIAQCLKNNQRVIYTTPIKALGNQKFRDFNEEFGDVGLMTGDTTINELASCLVMTTEILRTMLYQGSDVTREVGWVIFDEIHYMRDKERGYVWEESIILLSASVKLVFLSATIPNARQFAEWICFVHNHPCHVVYTESRPTPLEHCLFPANTENIYLIVDKKGNFKENNFSVALASLHKGSQTNDISTSKGEARSNAAFDCFKLVQKVIQKKYEPIIVFSFSKKECELYAKEASRLCFTDKEEEKLINTVINNALDLLCDEDRKMPCIQSYIPYLRKGIGVHHGGLIPIVKELTELLFGEGFVKVLFATETFAMGLNMPAKTVLFTGLQKFDGKIFRWITPGEYIQMSGRAGRRGKDDKGIVIMKVDDNINTIIVKNLFKGKADPMNSSFYLTYNMVLSMLRLECMNPEYILKRSFFQFQNYASLPNLMNEIKECTKKKQAIKLKNSKEIESYYKLSEKFKNLYSERHSYMIKCKRFVQLLNNGRLIKVIHNGINFGWCAILKKDPKDAADLEDMSCTIDILLRVSKDSINEKNCNYIHELNLLKPPVKLTEFNPVITSIPHSSIWELSARVVTLPTELVSMSSKRLGLRLIDECIAACIALPNFKLDPVMHLFMKDEEFISIIENMKKINNALEDSPIHASPDRDELLEKGKILVECQLEIYSLIEKVNLAKGLVQMSELKNRKRVLRRLGFLTERDVITKKGKLACELSAANELLLVEMLFNAQFQDLNPSECCALLSNFVCKDKAAKSPKLNYKLTMSLNQLQDTARRIAKHLWFCRLNEDEDAYVNQFQPFLMEVVYNWCNGRSFARVCKETTIFAGNIINSMRRLDVLLKQMVNAAAAIGLEDLEKKFTKGIELLKRDVIGIDSLYL